MSLVLDFLSLSSGLKGVLKNLQKVMVLWMQLTEKTDEKLQYKLWPQVTKLLLQVCKLWSQVIRMLSQVT